MQDFSKDANYFITSCVSAITIFSAWRTSQFSYRIFQKKRKAKRLEKNPVVSVDELKGRGHKINDIIIVKGRVGTADGREVTKNLGWGKTEKLAIQMKFTEPIYSNDTFNMKKDNYKINMNDALKRCMIEGSSKITLGEGQKNTILLKNFDNKDYSRVLDVLSWTEERRSLSLTEHINAFFLSILRAIVMIGSTGKDDGSYIRGLQIGKRDVEAGLRVGASISILGSVGLTLDGDMIIQVHEIFKERLTELEKLREEIPALIEKRNVWLLATVAGSIYLARRVYKHIKKNDIKIPLINP